MADKTMTMKEMEALLKAAMDKAAKLEAELAAKSQRTISFKVSELGAVSIYGLGRFPVTLYKAQVESLLAKVEDLKVFIEANKDKLSTGKDDTRFKAVREARAAKAAGVSE